jgi:hypothetical protein
LTLETRRTMNTELGPPTASLRLQGRINTMKHILIGVAVVAALAFAAPVWAQGVSPSGGNAMGMPGPNPGGPGLTPYSGGAPPAAMAPGPAETTSAMPPSHRHARHASHGKPSHHPSNFSNLQGNVANQLNQEELARLQSGDTSMPPAPPSPEAGTPPPTGGVTGANRMSTGGRPTSTRYGR